MRRYLFFYGKTRARCPRPHGPEMQPEDTPGTKTPTRDTAGFVELDASVPSSAASSGGVPGPLDSVCTQAVTGSRTAEATAADADRAPPCVHDRLAARSPPSSVQTADVASFAPPDEPTATFERSDIAHPTATPRPAPTPATDASPPTEPMPVRLTRRSRVPEPWNVHATPPRHVADVARADTATARTGLGTDHAATTTTARGVAATATSDEPSRAKAAFPTKGDRDAATPGVPLAATPGSVKTPTRHGTVTTSEPGSQHRVDGAAAATHRTASAAPPARDEDWMLGVLDDIATKATSSPLDKETLVPPGVLHLAPSPNDVHAARLPAGPSTRLPLATAHAIDGQRQQKHVREHNRRRDDAIMAMCTERERSYVQEFTDYVGLTDRTGLEVLSGTAPCRLSSREKRELRVNLSLSTDPTVPREVYDAHELFVSGAPVQEMRSRGVTARSLRAAGVCYDDWVVQNGLTLADLKLVQGEWRDLVEMGYQASDIVANRSYEGPVQLVRLFGVTWDDLETGLGLTVEDAVTEYGFTTSDFAAFGETARSLIRRGLNAENVREMKEGEPELRCHLDASPAEVRQLLQPACSTSSGSESATPQQLSRSRIPPVTQTGTAAAFSRFVF